MARPPLALAPFRGLRYTDLNVGRALDSGELDAAALLAPPYDVPGPEEARDLLRSDPHNAAHLTVPYQLNPTVRGDGAGRTSQVVYEGAATRLRAWIGQGILAQDPEPALYVYEQTTAAGVRQRGLIGALALPPVSSPAREPVRPHEEVDHGPVLDRLRLTVSTGAHLEPVFLLYPGGGGAATRVAEDAERRGRALVDTRTADGTRHRLWALTGPAVHAEIAADLAPRTALIADGHHRYAAYQEMHASGRVPGSGHGLAYLVDSDTHPPDLGAIHRVVPGLDTAAAVGAARSAARVEELTGASLPDAERALAGAGRPALLLADPSGRFHLVRDVDAAKAAQAAPSRSRTYRELPTAVLEHVLLPLWGYAEHQTRKVHDDPAKAVAAAREEHGTAVIVPPLRVEQVYAVADRGELTPRKSTSFGPKPRTGLVMRLLP
ncbi:DUF1015 family protein [Nocardiopsis sp. CNT312]|uniref:DUF1015 family protein n=1 Tax=Nocardiopsis sp. CNT312 TaxID=1137268 RepID=UPI00048D8446|nr:DUF1015 domain-containing protein [Nocardiopsis sp. CNT312]